MSPPDDQTRKALRRQELYRSLTNQTPSSRVIEQIEYLRGVAKRLGGDIIDHCPPSREASLAITHLEETVMWAVKALVLNQDDEDTDDGE